MDAARDALITYLDVDDITWTLMTSFRRHEAGIQANALHWPKVIPFDIHIYLYLHTSH